MFQGFPLQISLPALAVEGVRLCEPVSDPSDRAGLIFARQGPRGGNLDRAGLSPAEMKIHALLDGTLHLAAVAERAGVDLATAADVVRGLELIGLVERRSPEAGGSVLVLEDDPEAVRVIQSALGPEGEGCQLKVVRDRIGAQLLLRRNGFDLVLMALDRPEQEVFFRSCKEQCPATTRFVGIVTLDDEGELARLDAAGLDGILHRPLVSADLRTTAKHLLGAREPAGVA
jgi:CheY-like chemotaxis protein